MEGASDWVPGASLVEMKVLPLDPLVLLTAPLMAPPMALQ
jgi:hypothetical protein